MRVAGALNIMAANFIEWRERPFVWGSWDCLHFACAHVYAMTGVDYRDQFPQYATQEEALAILAGFEGGIVGLITSVLGEPKSAKKAQRGDLVLGDVGMGPASGVCDGAKSFWVGEHGLIARPTSIATLAWTV